MSEQAYYNEIEPFAGDWLENLIASKQITAGKVDRRSIVDVKAEDVAGFERCHFFAGIAGWDLALSLAGWDGPVWTASCPCQPFSSAGKQKGTQDERHLWPVQFGLVDAVRPPIVFGEQVSSAIGHGWLDGVFADLEGAGYTCGAAVLGAHSVGAPHIRQRLYWFGCRLEFANSIRQRGERIEIGRTGEAARTSQGTLRQCKCNNEGESNDDPESNIQCDSGDCRRDSVERLSDSTSSRREGAGERPANGHRDIADSAGSGLRNSAGVDEQWTRGLRQVASCEDRGPDSGIYRFSAWSHFTIGRFRDGKSRRIGCGVQPLAHGIPRGLGQGQPELSSLVRRASGNRKGRLKGYGNAIVPQDAAIFIRAVMDWMEEAT